MDDLIRALRFYADRDNWRSAPDVTQADMRVLDPEHVPASLTGQRHSGIWHGWEVAEEALLRCKSQPTLGPSNIELAS